MKKIINYISFVIRSSPVGFLASCLLYLCNLLFAAGLYGMASFIISLAALHPTYDAMMIPVVAVRFFGLGRAVLSYTERYCSHDNTFRILKNLRLKLYDKMVPVLPEYGTRRAQNLSKLISDIELLQEGILRLVYPIVSSIFLLLAGMGIAYLLHPLLSVTFLFLFLSNYYLFPMIMFYFNVKKKGKVDYDKQKLYEDLLELKEGINEITSDGREQEWLGRIEGKLLGMNGNIYEHQSAVAFCEALIVFLQGISMLILVVVAAYLSWKGEVPAIYLAAGILALTSLVTEAILPSQTYFKFSGLKRAADNVLEVKKDISGYYKTEEVIVDSEETLHVRNISWGYPNAKRLFHHFSMELKKGTIVAIIGESGCGKSTLINIILGFLKPSEGEITIGHRNLLAMSECERFQLFSVVDQKPFLFHQTIYENLQLANPQATEEQMMEALKRVSLWDFIVNLEHGLHTYVYEWGANLSGGELQRLAIARALLKNAPFYIFDEPTAGLDTINEKIIMNLILELSADHGVLLITHRPNRMESFDSVLHLGGNLG